MFTKPAVWKMLSVKRCDYSFNRSSGAARVVNSWLTALFFGHRANSTQVDHLPGHSTASELLPAHTVGSVHLSAEWETIKGSNTLTSTATDLASVYCTVPTWDQPQSVRRSTSAVPLSSALSVFSALWRRWESVRNVIEEKKKNSWVRNWQKCEDLMGQW